MWHPLEHCSRTFGEVPANASCQKWSTYDLQRDGSLFQDNFNIFLLLIWSVFLIFLFKFFFLSEMHKNCVKRSSKISKVLFFTIFLNSILKKPPFLFSSKIMFISLLKSQSSFKDYTLELIIIKDKGDPAKFCSCLTFRCNHWGFYFLN